jgi:aminopeptidase N
LRAETSVGYIPESLALLEELQRTGDIFFPKGWLDATLGYYRSPEAGDAVRAYLEQNKDLRQDLRNKLLQSADMLFRAEQQHPEASLP